jgi:hypothetical protein
MPIFRQVAQEASNRNSFSTRSLPAKANGIRGDRPCRRRGKGTRKRLKVPPSGMLSGRAGPAGRTLGDVTGEASTEPEWVEATCRVAQVRSTNPLSIQQLFRNAAPDLSSSDRFTTLVVRCLDKKPELVEAWQGYPYDKRTDRGPYMEGHEVGYFDGRYHDVRYHDVRNHADLVNACADFILREATNVLFRGGAPGRDLPGRKGPSAPRSGNGPNAQADD